MTVIELLRTAAEIARNEMHDESAAFVLDGQADIAEQIEECRAAGSEHEHAGYDQLLSMVGPELDRPELERTDFMRRFARRIGTRDGLVN